MRRKLFSVHTSAKQSRGLALSVVLLLAFCSLAGSQPCEAERKLFLRKSAFLTRVDRQWIR